MKKKIITCLLVLMMLLLTGCKINQNDGKKRLYLSDKYYSKGEYIDISSKDLLDKEDETYVLFTYNNYCNLSVPCDEIFSKIMAKYKIDFLSIPYEDFKNTNLHETVEFAPSIIIVNQGEIVAYLDAESDEDIIRYTDASEFEKWLDKYIYFSAKK